MGGMVENAESVCGVSPNAKIDASITLSLHFPLYAPKEWKIRSLTLNNIILLNLVYDKIKT